MPITTLDPQTALIIIDLQAGILGYPTIEPVDQITKRAGALADAFRSHGLPVVLVNVNGAPASRTDENPTAASRQLPEEMTAFVDDLNQQPDDHIITKQTWGAFTGTGLDEHLRALDVTQVVIAGISTSVGVESTARHAHENGFHVTLALDAMTDTNAAAHHNSTTHIFPRLGETGTTHEIIDLLARGHS
jgi:nicotinamidase-related amidase